MMYYLREDEEKAPLVRRCCSQDLKVERGLCTNSPGLGFCCPRALAPAIPSVWKALSPDLLLVS